MIEALSTLEKFNKLPATQEKADIYKKMVEGQISAAMYYHLAEKYVANNTLKGI